MRRIRGLFPWTLLGLLTMATASAALKWLAYPEMDLVMLIVGYAMIALPVLCSLLVSLSALFVRRRVKQFAPALFAVADTERATTTGFELPSLRFVPFLTLRWTVVEPTNAHAEPSFEGGRARERLTFDERGDVKTLTRRIVVADVFGLSRISFQDTRVAPFEVLPNTGAFRQLFSLSSFAGGDESAHPMGLTQGDRTELRRYAAGDPARFIHWKAFARTRRLLVRQPERALTRARRTIAYLVAGPSDDATAGVARAALQTHAFGEEWSFGADGSSAETSQLAPALRLIVESVRAKGQGAAGLAAFFARAERSGPASAVLFVPPRPGPWLARALSSLRARQPMRVVIGVDSLKEVAEVAAWKRFFIRGPSSDGPTMRELEEVVRAFKKARCEVLVLDRSSGRVWSDSHRRAAAKPALVPAHEAA